MLMLMQALLKQLHRTWKSMGSSSYHSILALLFVTYIVLSIELLVEFLRSWARRSANTRDDMRRVQTWQDQSRKRRSPTPVSGQ